MKRATSMLGALALMAAGFLFAAPAAHAVEGYITPLYNAGNGVMCEPRVGGTLWPTNGTNTSNAMFYYCGTSTATNRGQAVYNSLKGIASTEPTIGALFTTNNVKIYVMSSALQYAQAAGQSACAVYTAQKTTPAHSIFTPQHAIIVYENLPTASGNCTNFSVAPQSTTLQSHDVKHEAGHHFDIYNGTLSDKTTFKNLYPDDQTYETSHNPNHASDSVAYAYWWGSRQELFAEEFAIAFGSFARPVDTPTSNYYRCTRIYTYGIVRDQAAPTNYSYSWCTP